MSHKWQVFKSFDYGVTHSFVSHACGDKLGLPMRKLELGLVVSIPTSNGAGGLQT